MSDLSEIEKIHAALDRVDSRVREFGETARAEIEKHAVLSKETRANVDGLLLQQGELMARLQAAEQMVATFDQVGRVTTGPSVAEQVTESEEFRAWVIHQSGRFRMPVKAAITSAPGSGADLIVPHRLPGIVAPGMQRLTVRDLLQWGRTTSSSVEFARELLYTNNAAPVSENPSAGKPQSALTFEAASAAVATIAHWVPASRQVLADVPMLQSYIGGRLMYGLKLVEEEQLLNGSGVGLNIDGLVTQATPYVNPGVTVQAEQRIDRIRLALLQVELALYYADGIVLSPQDWAAIELLKTGENAYLYANPRLAGTPALWGRNVVPTPAMSAGDFLVGAFQLGAQGWDREDASIAISFEDRDNFIKNMVTILAEERLALTVYRPQAFVTGSFDDLDASA